MISDKRAEEALRYLVETDQEHARIKAEYKAKDALTKTVLAYEFMGAEGTGEVRKAISYKSEKYQEHIKSLEALEINLQKMYNKRDTERLVIDMWRTQAANQRKGNI